jgi:hypothetical protein
MADTEPYPYATHLDIKYGPLELVGVRLWGAISCANYPSRRRQDSVGGTL